MPQTLYDKLWQEHVIRDFPDGTSLIYVDRHLLHEVSTPQSFVAMDSRGLGAHRPSANLAVADHALPTLNRDQPIADPHAAAQTALLEANVARHKIPYIPVRDQRQGIVHVIGPEQGFTLPGMTLACGDSHTSTHGAFGALAFGIGASECGIVMAVQALVQRKARNMRVRLTGRLAPGVSTKDVALQLIARIGANGAAGHSIEYTGDALAHLSMEARMTLCNMAIEAGARVALISPDDVTFAYLKGRPLAPSGVLWDQALAKWQSLRSDAGAIFDTEVTIDLADLAPQVTWGNSPEDALPVTGRVPVPEGDSLTAQRQRRALDYMGLTPGQALEGLEIDVVFIGSCTNGRLEDFEQAAKILKGRRLHPRVRGIAVPGSGLVRAEAEARGIAQIFRDAGFEWREAGCSMCVAMNGDRIGAGQRCASTSNRNFEGRQGKGGRTHLVSPVMAAAAAVSGALTDVRRLEELV